MSRSLILVSLLALVTNVAFAAEENNFSDEGVYLTAQAGNASTVPGFFDEVFSPIHFRDNVGFAGRIGMGYQLNRYFAVETGLARYPSATRVYNSDWSFLPDGYTGSSTITNIYSADLMGFLRIPMGNYFWVAGGAGVAATHFSYSALNATNGVNSQLSWQSGSAVFFAPKAEVRVGVKATKQVAVFVSAANTFSVNGDDLEVRNYQPSFGMLSVGLNYSLE